MATSITDIARMLDISPSTVSRVLNGKGNVSVKMRAKILETAKDLNYIPNIMARNLQQKNSNVIGVVVPDITDSFFGTVVKGIDSVLSANGYNFFLCNTDENENKEKKYINTLYENRVAGMIVATIRNEIPLSDILFKGDVPVCFFDNFPRTDNRYHCVITDNFKIGQLAAEHLIEKGHTKIAAIMGKQSESTGQERYRGFYSTLKEYGIECADELCKFSDFKEESGKKAMIELIEKGGFSAVFIASSKMVYGALLAIRNKDKKIPEDISVVGVDVTDKYHVINPGITSVIQPEFEIGRNVASLLVERLGSASSSDGYRRVYLEPNLMERNSVMKV